MFTDHCKVSQSAVEMARNNNSGEKFDAQKYCYKNEAIKHLKEKAKCSEKAGKYVDFVFE